MTNICINIRNGEAVAELTGVLTTGMVGVPVHFQFGPEWDGLSVVAVFRGSTVTLDRAMPGIRDTTVPHEVLALKGSTLYVGAEGRNAAGDLIIPSTMAPVGIIQEGADPSGDESIDPSQPIWAELMAMVQALAEQSLDKQEINRALAVHDCDLLAHGDIRRELNKKLGLFDVVDDLETADATKALSANMGKVLSAKIENDVLTAQKAVEAQVKERVKTVNGVGPDANGNVEVAGGGSVIVDDTLSISSTNPVQNKVITQGIFQAMEMLERDVFPNLLPAVTAEDNGKFLRVSAGVWAAVAMASAEGVGF